MPHPEQKSPDSEPLILPPLTSKPRLLAALNEVVQALASGRIKRSVADTLLSSIKFANRLLTQIDEAGLSVDPSASAPRSVWVPTLPELKEFKRIFQHGTPMELRDLIVAKQTGQSPTPPAKPTTWQPTGEVAARIAATGMPDSGTDLLVKEMMAQIHQQSAGAKRPNAASARP